MMRFLSFGEVIGPTHLAVWFRKGEGNTESTDVGVMRSNVFSRRLRLPPSKSPYIIITSDYPGPCLPYRPDTFNKLNNYSVIELNNLDAIEITRLLNSVADQLVIEGIYKIDPKSESYWRTWQKAFVSSRDHIVGFSKKIKLSIHTTFFKLEIEP